MANLRKQWDVNNLVDIEKSENKYGVSDKYVEIKTSNVVRELHLNVERGKAYRNGHYVILNSGDIKTIIENSFNGTRSFRIHFEYNDLHFGYFRQVHKGKKINEFDLVQNINEYSKRASGALKFLKEVEIEPEEKRILFETAFKAREVKIERLITTPEHLSNNYYEFLKELFDMIETGNFIVSCPKSRTNVSGYRHGRKISNDFRMFNIQNKVWEKLQEINFEYFL